MDLEEGQVVMCTVEKIVGTTVFVQIEDDGEGTIITSEIAPGRIRNLRDYVVPKKKIVCKVLRIDKGGHVDLSLRRVNSKEKKQVMEIQKKEKSLIATLKTITENSEEIIKKIKEKGGITDFFEEVKTRPEMLEKLMTKEAAEKLLKILNEKKEKEVSVKKEFHLKSEAGDGLTKIKGILPKEASYIAAGKFALNIKDKNYKDANHRVLEILQDIEKKAHNENLIFSYEKKK